MTRRYLHTTIRQDKKYFEETRDIYLHTILPKLLGDVETQIEAGIDGGAYCPPGDDRHAQFCEIIKAILKDPSLYQLISLKMTPKEIRWKVSFPQALLWELGGLSGQSYGEPEDPVTIVFKLKRWRIKKDLRNQQEWKELQEGL